jgi:hypothetical protein
VSLRDSRACDDYKLVPFKSIALTCAYRITHHAHQSIAWLSKTNARRNKFANYGRQIYSTTEQNLIAMATWHYVHPYFKRLILQLITAVDDVDTTVSMYRTSRSRQIPVNFFRKKTCLHTRFFRHGAFNTNTLKIHMESSNETWATVYRSQQHITHKPL